MAKVKIYLDPVGNTMNIWWDSPKSAHISEETESPNDNDVIVKDTNGIPIGLEIIGVFPDELNIVKLLQDKKLPFKETEPFMLEVDKPVSE